MEFITSRKGIRILEPKKFLLEESGIRDFFSCGIWNPGLWNPEYSLRNQESHLRLESTIHVPLTKNPESKTWNPESKSVLDSPLHEEKFKLYETIRI